MYLESLVLKWRRYFTYIWRNLRTLNAGVQNLIEFQHNFPIISNQRIFSLFYPLIFNLGPLNIFAAATFVRAFSNVHTPGRARNRAFSAPLH